MNLEHTCPSTTESSRVSAKWLAKTYESLFRSDPTTSIQTLIDACNEKYGVEVPKHMAYRAKNLAVESVLGEHKKQYPRLRDYAATIMQTNPGSRVVVTTLVPKATKNTTSRAKVSCNVFLLKWSKGGISQWMQTFHWLVSCFFALVSLLCT